MIGCLDDQVFGRSGDWMMGWLVDWIVVLMFVFYIGLGDWVFGCLDVWMFG